MHVLAVVGDLLVVGGSNGALQVWSASASPRYRGWSKVGGELLDPAAFAQTSAKLGLGDTPVEDLDYVEDDEEIDETALAEQTLSGWLTKRSGRST